MALRNRVHVQVRTQLLIGAPTDAFTPYYPPGSCSRRPNPCILVGPGYVAIAV